MLFHYTRLIINHWGGTCPLRTTGPGGGDPWTLRVKGTRNIHAMDASLYPAPLSAHPVATIMAVAEKASDILSRLL
jgi:choline dehydrogenase-like flavoprotein